VLYGVLCNLGIKGGLIVGVSVSEVLTSYWRSKHNQSQSLSKVYLFGRRIHHGELGALLGLSSLLLRISHPAAALGAFFTGLGIGLAKDDYPDILEWFKFQKT
jgi:hypothetical protein